MSASHVKPKPRAEQAIDWADLRRRLDAAQAGHVEADPQALLESRARALAQATGDQEAKGAEQLRLLTFSLGGERYAVELRHVVEVFRLPALSPLPGAPAPVFGLTAWRGELLTLLDLRRILGLASERLDDLRIALVLGERSAPVAVLADGVDDVLVLDPRSVRPAPEGAAATERDYVRGVTSDAVLVLDGAWLLERHAQEG
jgi:purine-binding chemotaxis protein CheW